MDALLLNSRIFIICGSGLIFVVVGLLYGLSPIPNDLSKAHSQVITDKDLSTCNSCHSGTGLSDGCLSCHEEIAGQLEEQRGYHFYLAQDGELLCGECHVEHLGGKFQLVNSISWGEQEIDAFTHPHVEFNLQGAHDQLDCAQCHEENLKEPFRLEKYDHVAREHSYLGLDQLCTTCHNDPHAGGMTGACDDCHGQDEFDPTVHFDHNVHFPLVGGHDNLDCSACHIMPSAGAAPEERPWPFIEVRGTICQDCHQSPHDAQFEEKCEECHVGTEGDWTSAHDKMTAERHYQVGFNLGPPHDNVDCSGCHNPDLPFLERHPDKTSNTYNRQQENCVGCHTDVHRNQFDTYYSRCLDCHEPMRFLPTTFNHERHSKRYELTGAHIATPCNGCHQYDEDLGARRFIKTSHNCRDCHQDLHAGQFDAEILDRDCVACHSPHADTFSLSPFNHEEETGYKLIGQHQFADCQQCHVEVAVEYQGKTVVANRYRGTPQNCESCHRDVHRGQFTDYPSCESCHVSCAHWSVIQFDHQTQTRFPLEGAHLNVPCSGCHKPEQLEDGYTMVRYKPLGRECQDCHDVDPRTEQNR